jgi:hypothetical protein
MRPAEVGGPVEVMVSQIMTLRVATNTRNFLTSRVNISLSRRVVIHGVNDVLGN